MTTSAFMRKYLEGLVSLEQAIRRATPFPCSVLISVKPTNEENTHTSPIVITDVDLDQHIEWLKQAKVDPNVSRHEGRLEDILKSVKVKGQELGIEDTKTDDIPEEYKQKG